MYTWNRHELTKTYEDKAERNFYDFAIYLGNRLMKSIQTFFLLERTPNPFGPDRTKIAEVGAE